MLKLYIGNKNYSSWSLRPWILLRTLRIPFDEERIPLYGEGSVERLARISPSAKVPCLHDGDVVVWDSLAIVEYLAEHYTGVWPRDAMARAWARSAAAEMHSGFADLRNEMGMNVRLHRPQLPSPKVAANIARVVAIWHEGRERFASGGEFLCGPFGAVDAFFAPVALRFETYEVALPPRAQAYCDSLLRLPALREWCNAARAESERIPEFEPADL
jgi:glutathione S-transferase